jgi:two-component system chemotaxis sensor kinase CheA
MTKFDAEGAMGEFFAECEEILQRVTSVLTKLESQKISSDVIDSLYRDVHTLKGSSQLFGFHRIGIISHAIEASLEPVRRKKVQLDRNFVDQVFKSLDLISRILKNPKLDLENDPALHEELLLILPKLIETSNKRFSAEFELGHSLVPSLDLNKTQIESLATPVKKEVQLAPSGPSSYEISEATDPLHKRVISVDEPSVESSTIRVHVGLLDKLMNLVSEMVLARNQVLQYARSSDDNEFISLTQRLDLVTSELQDNVMRTRMQPVGAVFGKFNRVVRDLSRELGKNIELVVEGAETELDKSLIEAIKDPLTHIVRNSCDHGIESLDERVKKGKTPNGVITLKAFQEGGHVIIEIRDNGRGLDPKKILTKALEKRIISSEKADSLSTLEIQQLIFAPGFSTADHVSSVSGRGVGMDIVRTNIEKVGGLIDLSSQVGEGTKIKLLIPLTLAIVPAMIIRSGKDYFAISQVKLQELLRVDMEENKKAIEKLQGQYVYRLRGELLPLVDLSGILNPIKKNKEIKSIFNIVVLKTDDHIYGLIVDEIIDTADIVVKPLPQFLKKINSFSGATIMGDGNVALILDTQGLAELSGAHRLGQSKETDSKILPTSKFQIDNTSEYLFLKLSTPGYFALPLILVHRLEEFDQKEVEISGVEKMVKYRGSLLPLIYLNNYLGHKENSNQVTESKLSVVVVSKHSRYFGLVVNEIVDILTSDREVTQNLREVKGIMGTVIFNDKQVVTILDALSIIDDVIGIPVSSRKKKKLSNTRVLFAEDTVFFARQVIKLLESIGVEVDHAENGLLAWEKLKKADSNHYGLIVSDIEMPSMNGYEFAKSVKTDPKFKSIPMIALTTRFNEMDQKRGMDSGFNKYLEKLKSDELLDALYDLLGVH